MVSQDCPTGVSQSCPAAWQDVLARAVISFVSNKIAWHTVPSTMALTEALTMKQTINARNARFYHGLSGTRTHNIAMTHTIHKHVRRLCWPDFLSPTALGGGGFLFLFTLKPILGPAWFTLNLHINKITKSSPTTLQNISRSS